MNSMKVIMQKLGSLSLILIVLFCPNGDAGKVDCRKFVFAPICRGVAAKRAVQQDIISSLLHDENSRVLLNRRSRMNEINEDESFPADLRLEDLSNKAGRDIFREQSEEQETEQEEEKAAAKDSLISDLRRYWGKVKVAVKKTNDQQKSVGRILDAIRNRLQARYNSVRQDP